MLPVSFSSLPIDAGSPLMHFRLLRTRLTARLLLLAGVAVLVLFVACVFFRIGGPRDIRAYCGMIVECHPVWRQFALRRFGPGDSAQELLKRFPPAFRDDFGRYSVYWYNASKAGLSYTNLRVVSRDGWLLRAEAASCTWEFSFFNTSDPEFDGAYAGYVRRPSGEPTDGERHPANAM